MSVLIECEAFDVKIKYVEVSAFSTLSSMIYMYMCLILVTSRNEELE